MYEKAKSVIYTASVLNQTATRLAGFEAGVGSDLVVVSPSSLTLTIVNIDGKVRVVGVLCVHVCITCQLGCASPCSCAHWVCAAGV